MLISISVGCSGMKFRGEGCKISQYNSFLGLDEYSCFHDLGYLTEQVLHSSVLKLVHDFSIMVLESRSDNFSSLAFWISENFHILVYFTNTLNCPKLALARAI